MPATPGTVSPCRPGWPSVADLAGPAGSPRRRSRAAGRPSCWTVIFQFQHLAGHVHGDRAGTGPPLATRGGDPGRCRGTWFGQPAGHGVHRLGEVAPRCRRRRGPGPGRRACRRCRPRGATRVDLVGERGTAGRPSRFTVPGHPQGTRPRQPLVAAAQVDGLGQVAGGDRAQHPPRPPPSAGPARRPGRWRRLDGARPRPPSPLPGRSRSSSRPSRPTTRPGPRSSSPVRCRLRSTTSLTTVASRAIGRLRVARHPQPDPEVAVPYGGQRGPAAGRPRPRPGRPGATGASTLRPGSRRRAFSAGTTGAHHGTLQARNVGQSRTSFRTRGARGGRMAGWRGRLAGRLSSVPPSRRP